MAITASNAVVDLNNEAVSYLQEGNYRAAVGNLEMALQRLANDNPVICNEKMMTNTSDGINLRVKSVPIAPSGKNAASQNNIFDFYRRAFQISIAPSRAAQQSNTHFISNTIVVKFNMAIAYHDDAARRNNGNHFRRALDLYEDILYLMKDKGVRGHLLLLMAIGNNMGHIHSHLLNYSQTREALYWVRQLAIECRQHVANIPHDDYLFFYNTVIIFNGKDLNVAPAA